MTQAEYMFRNAFERAGRGGQFSYEGMITLFQHLTDLAGDSGEELELDVIALCCDYTEYDTIVDALGDYPDYTYDDFHDATDVIPVAESDRVIVRTIYF